jgi:ankyrin repeat protein
MASALRDAENVFNLAHYEEENAVQLEAFLKEHPGVDVNLHQDEQGHRSIHGAASKRKGNVASTRLLIKAKADLEVRNMYGATLLSLVSATGDDDVLQVLIENKADVRTANDDGVTPTHKSSYHGRHKCVRMLIDANVDVNAKDVNGFAPVMNACQEDRLACLQLLVDNNADLSITTAEGGDALYASMVIPGDEHTHRVPGMPFALLSCNTDVKNVLIDHDEVTQATIDAHVKEYKQVQSYIDECHTIITETLGKSRCCGGIGMRGAPLKQVLLYLGMSTEKNQTVNKSIDRKRVKRALIPRQPINANMWFNVWKKQHQAKERASETLADWGCVVPTQNTSGKKNNKKKNNNNNNKKKKKKK